MQKWELESRGRDVHLRGIFAVRYLKADAREPSHVPELRDLWERLGHLAVHDFISKVEPTLAMYSPPYVDRIWGIGGSSDDIPKAIF